MIQRLTHKTALFLALSALACLSLCLCGCQTVTTPTSAPANLPVHTNVPPPPLPPVPMMFSTAELPAVTTNPPVVWTTNTVNGQTVVCTPRNARGLAICITNPPTVTPLTMFTVGVPMCAAVTNTNHQATVFTGADVLYATNLAGPWLVLTNLPPVTQDVTDEVSVLNWRSFPRMFFRAQYLTN